MGWWCCFGVLFCSVFAVSGGHTHNNTLGGPPHVQGGRAPYQKPHEREGRRNGGPPPKGGGALMRKAEGRGRAGAAESRGPRRPTPAAPFDGGEGAGAQKGGAEERIGGRKGEREGSTVCCEAGGPERAGRRTSKVLWRRPAPRSPCRPPAGAALLPFLSSIFSVSQKGASARQLGAQQAYAVCTQQEGGNSYIKDGGKEGAPHW